MKVTLKEIAQKKGISKWAVIKRKHKEGWRPCEYIPNPNGGGKIELFALSDLPKDIQELFLPANSTPDGDKPIEQASGTTLSWQGFSPAPATSSSEIKPVEAPQRAKRIALARYELLRLWQEYREGHKWGSLEERDKEFLDGYNTGKLYPGIFEELGNVTIKSLYRWWNDLDGTDNWERLIPGYYFQKKEISLSPVEQKIVINFLLDPRKFKPYTAIRYAKHRLKVMGYEDLASDITYKRYIDRWIKQNYDLYIFAREGDKAYEDKVGYYIRRDPSVLEVGEVLVADGHRLNFQVINPFTGKPCRAVLVGYVDWKSYDLAGYEIMIEENTQCIASALRQAIIRLGKIPKVTYQDNGKAFKSKYFTNIESFEDACFSGLFARLGIKPVFAEPYNARAKIIEGWFKNFTNQFERLMPSYVGSNINDKPAWNLRNEKFHKALHKEYIPTIEEAIAFIETWLNWYRQQPCPHVKGKTIGEVFEEGKGSGVDISALDDLMMEAKVTRIGRHGIRFLGADYWHDSFTSIRGTVIIRYSFFDMSFVKVYTERGEYLGDAERVQPVHPVAEILGEVKDKEALERELKRQARLKKKVVCAVKELLNNGKNVVDPIDWPSVIQAKPSLVKEMEKQNIVLPAIEEHIPDEAVADRAFIPEEVKSKENPYERPFFGDDVIARYEWHLKNGFQTQEDIEFKEWFEKSDIYRMLYQQNTAWRLGKGVIPQ
jgi:putative transposase